jgi:hypothetical protein
MENRRKMRPVSEQMKEWAAHLDGELSSWPGVSRRPMFGLILFYRDGRVFAALPRTKCFHSPDSVGFKIYSPINKLAHDERISVGADKTQGWVVFRMDNANDINGALKWFELAYRNSGSSKTTA